MRAATQSERKADTKEVGRGFGAAHRFSPALAARMPEFVLVSGCGQIVPPAHLPPALNRTQPDPFKAGEKSSPGLDRLSRVPAQWADADPTAVR